MNYIFSFIITNRSTYILSINLVGEKKRKKQKTKERERATKI
jgi:hypothetical protein